MALSLADITDFIIDTKHNTPKFANEGYPCIRTSDIGRGFLKLDNVKRVSEKTYRQWIERAEPRENDLILAREAPVGNVAIVPKKLPLCIGQRTVLIRPDKSKILPRYLCYLLLGNEMQGKMRSLSGGATVAHLNMRDIRNLSLPKIPEIEQQQRIVSILSAYDDLIENNTRRIKILEEMAQSLYREWFINFRFPGHEKVKMVNSPLGKIPKGWEMKKLGEICTIVMGQSPKSEFYNEIGEGLPFHQGVKDFGSRLPKDNLYCTVTNRVAKKGDILFSVRAPVGRINLSNKRIVIGRGLSAIRSKNGWQAFVFQQLMERFREEDIMGGGTIFKSVTKTDMHNIDLLVPAASVIDKFESIIGPIFMEIENLFVKDDNLRHTRDLLLPRIISEPNIARGKI